MKPARRVFLARACTLPLLPLAAGLATTPVHAHGGVEASAASSLSLSLPVAVLAAAPAAFLSAGVVLTVAAMETVGGAVVWTLRRASDGALASLEFSATAVVAGAVAIGSVVAVTAIAAGWLLSVAGEVICLVPNALGQALLYDERVR